jgi:hypothetical protein
MPVWRLCCSRVVGSAQAEYVAEKRRLLQLELLPPSHFIFKFNFICREVFCESNPPRPLCSSYFCNYSASLLRWQISNRSVLSSTSNNNNPFLISTGLIEILRSLWKSFHWNRCLTENLTVAKFVKRYLAFNQTWSFVVIKRWTCGIQSICITFLWDFQTGLYVALPTFFPPPPQVKEIII